jgi:hypothetical protein
MLGQIDCIGGFHSSVVSEYIGWRSPHFYKILTFRQSSLTQLETNFVIFSAFGAENNKIGFYNFLMG